MKALNFITNFLSVLGILWTLIEIFDFFGGNGTGSFLKSSWWLFLIIGLVYATYRTWPKSKLSFQVPKRDVKIFILKKNIIKIKGALIVPINSQFKVDNDGELIFAKSILAQIVNKYYKSEPQLLQTALNLKLKDDFYLKRKIDSNKWSIGTVVPIKIEQNKFYFLANTVLNAQNKSECSNEMLEISLNELWYFLSEAARKEDFVIPLLGTGYGRLTSRENVFREILLSFLSSLSQKNFADSLTIGFLPNDVKKFNIDFEKIEDFAHSKIRYQEYKTTINNGGSNNI